MADRAVSVEMVSGAFASQSWEVSAEDRGVAEAEPDLPVGSAEGVAFLRALATRERDRGIRLRDGLPAEFLDRRWRAALSLPLWLTRGLCERLHPGVYGLVVSRTHHIDSILRCCLRDGIRQLVILGAGYDTRPYRFADALRQVRIFEVDLPGTQARKRARIDGLGAAGRERVHYVATDLGRRSLEGSLLMAGYRLSRRTLFIAEGLLYYLPARAVDGLIRCAARNACPGSSLVFDYALQSFVDGDRSAFGARQSARWFADVGEPCLSGLAPAQLSRYLALRGFSLVSELGPRELERAYLTRDDGRLAHRCLGILRLAHARVPS